jgi:hypothetical protein
MFFELRQYRLRPGQREACVKFMDGVVIPFQVSKGMHVSGSFVGQDDEGLYVWIRRFETEEQCRQQYDAVYESDHWKTVIAPQLPALIDRDTISVVRLQPTAASLMK